MQGSEDKLDVRYDDNNQSPGLACVVCNQGSQAHRQWSTMSEPWPHDLQAVPSFQLRSSVYVCRP